MCDMTCSPKQSTFMRVEKTEKANNCKYLSIMHTDRWSKITHEEFIRIILDLFMPIELFYSVNLGSDFNYRFQITHKYTFFLFFSQ